MEIHFSLPDIACAPTHPLDAAWSNSNWGVTQPKSQDVGSTRFWHTAQVVTWIASLEQTFLANRVMQSLANITSRFLGRTEDWVGRYFAIQHTKGLAGEFSQNAGQRQWWRHGLVRTASKGDNGFEQFLCSWQATLCKKNVAQMTMNHVALVSSTSNVRWKVFSWKLKGVWFFLGMTTTFVNRANANMEGFHGANLSVTPQGHTPRIWCMQESLSRRSMALAGKENYALITKIQWELWVSKRTAHHQ